MSEKLNPDGVPTTRQKYSPVFKAECVHRWRPDLSKATWLPKAFRPRCWAAGSARRWRKRCLVAPNTTKSNSCGQSFGAWRWSVIFQAAGPTSPSVAPAVDPTPEQRIKQLETQLCDHKKTSSKVVER